MFFRKTTKSRHVARRLTPTIRRRRPAATFAVAIVIAMFIYFVLPEPKTRKERTLPSLPELQAVVATMTTTDRPFFSATQKTRASLGRKLFSDKRLSKNGEVSCSSCHQPDLAFTDGKPLSVGVQTALKNSPTVVNHFLNTWFMWDGRADSLASQALKPLEDPNEHGFSRVGVVWQLLTNYDQEYKAAFGDFPSPLNTWQTQGRSIPKHGFPAARVEALEKSLSIDLAAYSLATLGRFSLLNDILATAQKDGKTPAVELIHRAFAPQPLASDQVSWPEDYATLKPEEMVAVDQVFANAGLALAAFEQGLVALDSPFDHFAARLKSAVDIKSALDANFDNKALNGLLTFISDAKCTLCHVGPNFTDQQFHNIGLEQLNDTVDLGRATGTLKVLSDPFNCEGPYLNISSGDPARMRESCRELPFLSTTNLEMIGAFKTPSLRNVALTAPYMHDGRFTALSDVLAHYNELSVKAAVGHREESLKALDLTAQELEELEAFLTSLSSPITDLGK